MEWLDLEDVYIICKKCRQNMIHESTHNSSKNHDMSMILSCPRCNAGIHLISIGKEGVSG